MNTAHNICNAIRAGNLSHTDIEMVFACFASSLQFSDLSDHTMSIVLDMIDEIVGQIEDDRIAQHEDPPGFEGTYESLDALTIRTTT